jgi:hypothetical protein
MGDSSIRPGGKTGNNARRLDPAFEAALDEARSLPVEQGLLGHRLKRVTASELAGPCPHWANSTDTLGVNVRKRRWICHRCDANGRDAISLVMHVADCDFLTAVELLTGVRRGDAPARRPTPRPRQIDRARQDAEEAEHQRRCLTSARRIIAEMVPIIGTPGEAYLRDMRGIDVAALSDVLERRGPLGWHRSLYFNQPDPEEPLHEFHGRRFPAIIAVMSDAASAVPTGAISRTYIGADGTKIGKAKTLGQPRGIIRLSPNHDVGLGLHLAEGLETALSAMALGLKPVWATGDTGLMKSFPVLDGIDALTIIADHDAYGQGEHAAQQAASRWRHAGREARILMPRDPGDLNDATRRTQS